MLSPVFKQNLYSGVYDDLLPSEVPEDIDLYSPNTSKYPLLAEAEDYIKTATVNKGDCLYIPSYYFI